MKGKGIVPRHSDRLKQFMGLATGSWEKMRSLAESLSDAELAQAEGIEKLGRRRTNVLRIIRAERYIRQGREGKMLKLKVEAR